MSNTRTIVDGDGEVRSGRIAEQEYTPFDALADLVLLGNPSIVGSTDSSTMERVNRQNHRGKSK
jgi:hypothetical protein